MSEPKRIYRIPPCSRYDIAGTESWLEDMAAQGWELEKDGFFLGFAHFLQAQPQRVRYRLEATDSQDGLFSDDHNPDQEAEHLNRLMGWNFIARRGQFYIYCCSDPAAPEMHTDPRVQAESLKALTKYQRTLLGNNLFMLVFYTLMHFSGVILSSAVYMGLIFFLSALVFVLMSFGGDVCNLIRISCLRKKLRHGERMSHRTDYRSTRWRYWCGKIVCLICVIVFVTSLLTTAGRHLTGEDAVPLEDWEKDFPFATLEDAFPGAELDYDVPIIDSEVIHWSNALSEENYDYTEYADITWEDTEFTGYLYLNHHECRFDWMARWMARELAIMSQGSLLDRLFLDRPEIRSLDVEADYAVTYSDCSTYVIVCRGNIVIRARYSTYGHDFYSPEEFARLLLESIS